MSKRSEGSIWQPSGPWRLPGEFDLPSDAERPTRLTVKRPRKSLEPLAISLGVIVNVGNDRRGGPQEAGVPCLGQANPRLSAIDNGDAARRAPPDNLDSVILGRPSVPT